MPARFPDQAGHQLSEAEIKSSRARMFDNLFRYFGELSTRSDAVFVIEDIHWADSDTLDFPQMASAQDTAVKGNVAFIICTAQADGGDPLQPPTAVFRDRILTL